MKLALRWIPTEVWVDVFRYPWITREELGKIVDRFRNRKFAEFLQFYLHEWGKRTLDELDLDEDENIPQTPLPENIKFFQCINIWHFDTRALDFLQRINTLFTGVNLNLMQLSKRDDLPRLGTVLDHLASQLHGIYSLAVKHNAIPLVEQHFAQQLVQTKIITLDIEWGDLTTIPTAINFCLDWLTTGDCNEPRFLTVLTCQAIFALFIEAIKQHFLSAKSPCAFFLFRHHEEADQMLAQNFQLDLENNIGEVLNGEFDEDEDFQIYRHPKDLAESKLVEWLEKADQKRNKSGDIYLSDELTIGPLEGNAGDNGVIVVEEEAENQPSPSKKPKLTC